MRSAIVSATDDLPDAVGPKMPSTRSAKKAAADARERLVGGAAEAQVVLHRAVAPLDLADRVVDRLGRGHGEVDAALTLLVVGRLSDPRLDQRGEVAAARDVVLDDLVMRNADQAEHERRDEAGAILAGGAVDDHRAGVRVRDRLDRRREAVGAV